MQRPIIVGIDGSAHALQALDWAVAEARLHEARLRLVMAVPPDGPGSRRDAALSGLLRKARAHAVKQQPDLAVAAMMSPRQARSRLAALPKEEVIGVL